MKFLIISVIVCLLDQTWAKSLYDEQRNIEHQCIEEKQMTPGQFNKIPITEKKTIINCIYEKSDDILHDNLILDKTNNSDKVLQSKYFQRLCSHISQTDPNDFAEELIDYCKTFSGEYFMRNRKIINNECKDKVGLSRDEYLTLQYLPVKNITKTMKLYPKCVLERHGFLKDNNLQEEVILKVSQDYKDAKHLKEFVRQCKGIKEDNENDTAFKLYECLEEIEDKYIQSTEDELKMAQRKCLKEKQLSPNQVFSEETPPKPTPALKMFANCVFNKMGYIKDGALQLPAIFDISERAKYPDNYLVYLFRCLNSTGNNNQDHELLAYNFALCFNLFTGEHFLKEWKIASSECEDFNEIIDRDEYSRMRPENPTAAMKYYAACVFKKLNFLRDNILQENVILKAMDVYRDKDYLQIFLKSCKQVKEKDHKDTAFRLFVCMEKIIYEY